MGTSYNGNCRAIWEKPTVYKHVYYVTSCRQTDCIAQRSASLQAAAHPAKTPYLYFVADGKGGHTFNTTHSHNRSVQEYLKVLKEKMGSNYIVIEARRRRKTTARDVVVETLEQLGIRIMIYP